METVIEVETEDLQSEGEEREIYEIFGRERLVRMRSEYIVVISAGHFLGV